MTKVEDVHSARIGVPTTLVEVKSVLNDGLVVQEPAAHDPIARHEAREVRADVSDGTAAVKIGEVCPVANSRCLLDVELAYAHTNGIDHTLRSVLMDESTAVAQLSAKMVSSVLVRRAYLMRYSK